MVSKDAQGNSRDKEAQPPSTDVGSESKLATEDAATAHQEIQAEVETLSNNTGHLRADVVSDAIELANLESGCHNMSRSNTAFVRSIHKGH